MKGIPVECTINETRVNISTEERKNSNGEIIVESGMLLSKLFFLVFWLLTMRITCAFGG